MLVMGMEEVTDVNYVYPHKIVLLNFDGSHRDVQLLSNPCNHGFHKWTGEDVHGSPAVAQGKVFAGSFDGKVYAFESAQPIINKPNLSVEEKTTNPWYEGYTWPIILSGIFLIVFGYALMSRFGKGRSATKALSI